MKISWRSFLWIIPFICFLMGYQLLKWALDVSSIQTPRIVGLHMHDAIKQLSAYQLNARILSEKEDPNVEEGVVIYQSPTQGSKIKPNQSVFVVITRKPPKALTPNFVGQALDEVKAQARNRSIRLKIYPIESSYPQNNIIAQQPMANRPLDSDVMTIYVSSGESKIRMVPDLKGLKLSEIDQFLNNYKIKTEIRHTKEIMHDCSNCVIAEQFPTAGTLVDAEQIGQMTLTLEPTELPVQ